MCFGIHDQPWVDYYRERLPELTPSCPLPQKGRLMGIRSSDEGKSWSQPFVVCDGPFSESDPQISVAPDAAVSGRVRSVLLLGQKRSYHDWRFVSLRC
jgi:hypothetical protein